MKNIFIAALLLLTSFAVAQNPADTAKQPGVPRGFDNPKLPPLTKGIYVTDLTGTLTKDQIANLNQRAATIQKKTGFELVIVLLDALPPKMDVNDATVSVDETWDPGEKPDADRLIYIAGLKQHGHRITAARGIKAGVLFNKTRCTSILTAMRPYYDKHNYNDGLQLMVDSISTVLHVDTGQSTIHNSTAVYIGAVILALILIAYAYFKSKQKKPVTS
jgi:uncharacterized membrane protein YgcG